jgi:hypothetical protein
MPTVGKVVADRDGRQFRSELCLQPNKFKPFGEAATHQSSSAPAAMVGAQQPGTGHLTGDELLLFQNEYQTHRSGLTGMRTRVTAGTEARDHDAKSVPPFETRDRSAVELP